MNADKVTTCQPLWGHCGPLHSAILEIIAHEQLHLFALWSWQRLRFYSFSFYFLMLIHTLQYTNNYKLISFGHYPLISNSIPFIRISCLIILWSQHKRCFPAVWTWKAINVQNPGNNFIIQHLQSLLSHCIILEQRCPHQDQERVTSLSSVSLALRCWRPWSRRLTRPRPPPGLGLATSGCCSSCWETQRGSSTASSLSQRSIWRVGSWNLDTYIKAPMRRHPPCTLPAWWGWGRQRWGWRSSRGSQISPEPDRMPAPPQSPQLRTPAAQLCLQT